MAVCGSGLLLMLMLCSVVFCDFPSTMSILCRAAAASKAVPAGVIELTVSSQTQSSVQEVSFGERAPPPFASLDVGARVKHPPPLSPPLPCFSSLTDVQPARGSHRQPAPRWRGAVPQEQLCRRCVPPGGLEAGHSPHVRPCLPCCTNPPLCPPHWRLIALPLVLPRAHLLQASRG